VYGLIALVFVPYAIAALVFGKTAHVELSLCGVHSRRRRIGLWAGLAVTPVSLALAVVSVVTATEALIYVAMSGITLGILLGLLWGRVVQVIRMDERYVALGVGRPFFDSLPPAGPG
jgi:hypothetical protein